MVAVVNTLTSLWGRKREIARHVVEISRLYFNRKSELLEIPLDICVNPLGFSYGKNGWHPVIPLIREIAAAENISDDLENSVFYKFYEKYKPTDMLHLVSRFDPHVAFAPPMGVLPWGGFTKKARESGGSPLKKTSWLCGPLDIPSIKLNIERARQLYGNMKKNGYAPWRILNSFIEGCLLQDKRGEKRFIVLHGKHRAAVLAFLGAESVLATYAPEGARTIKEEDVKNWYYVKNEQCSIHDALAYFHAYFKLTGKERADELGLLD